MEDQAHVVKPRSLWSYIVNEVSEKQYLRKKRTKVGLDVIE
jgi:hypothetical protein